MKLFSIVTAALLPVAAISTPLNKVRDLDAEAAGLVKKATQYCDIVNVVTEVDCWALPKHGGNGNVKITSLAGTRNNVEFTCYTNCEDVHGNT